MTRGVLIVTVALGAAATASALPRLFTLLSPIPETTSPAEVSQGPQLGRPPVTDTHVGALSFSLTDEEPAEAPLAAAINRVRRQHGLPVLRVSPLLDRAADAHARALATAGHFTHDWSDGMPFERWIVRFYPARGKRSWGAGENLLWSSAALHPDDAVAAWLASPGHRRVMLSRRWLELGVGVVGAEDASGAYGGRDVVVVAAEFGFRS